MQSTGTSAQTDIDIRAMYDAEYAEGVTDYAYLLNGFREHADRIAFVMKKVWKWQPKSLLDVGCQKGHFGALCNWTHRPLQRLVGVDISPLVGNIARTQHGYHEVHILNASSYFDLKEQFDLVLCMELLEHVPNPKQVIANCMRHVKVGGRALFSTPDEDGPIDGKIHVRNYGEAGPIHDIQATIGVDYRISEAYLPSAFCEKPHWRGWAFVEVEKCSS